MHKSTRAILSQNRNTISYNVRFNKLRRLKNDNNIDKRRKAIINLQFSKSMLSKTEKASQEKFYPTFSIYFFLCGIIIRLTKYRM